MSLGSGVVFPDRQHCELAYGAGNCTELEDGTWTATSSLAGPVLTAPEGTGQDFIDQESCEIVFGAANCYLAPNGYWYPNSILKTLVPKTQASTIDWDPLSWGKSALSDASGIFAPVYKWVLKQVVAAVSLVENDISKAYHYVNSRLGGVENTISHLAGQINSVIGGLPHDLTSTLDGVRHDVASWIDTAVKPIEADVDTTIKDAKGIGHDAEHYADTAIAAFEKDVLRPVENELRHLIHDAESEADHAWHVWYKDIWAPALHDLREAEHNAAKAVYFIDHSALDAIHLIDECWDWLLWFAKNPLRAFEQLPADALRQLTTGKLSGQADTVTAGFGGLVTELDKVYPDD